jgi:predicted transposase/invertase (TIGR01784 family)
MYSKQLAKGNPFERLKEVYALALVNSEAFDYEGDDGYMQEFYIINKAHPTDIHRDISLIFIELQKYKPADKGSKAIKDLWLKFLTEIDENTVEVEQVMLDNPEISQALNIVERSAYTDADIYVYEDYLLEVMTQRNSVLSAKQEGRVEGRAEGRAEGEKDAKIEIARKLKAKGAMTDEEIAEISGLTQDEISNI